MTATLLFCIAEDAKPFIHRILAEDRVYLVQSHNLPKDKSGFKTDLKEGEDFETEFIGTSLQNCQKWTLEKQFQVNFIQQNFPAIADERTSRDGTILMQCYKKDLGEDGELEFPPYGILPKERDTWYDFRIDPKGSFRLTAALFATEPDVIYPTDFGRKEELTDEYGVFNIIAANRAVGRDTYSAFECLYLQRHEDTGIWER
ncbi:uncharacterized protein EI97DRAFT_386432 [Westerdykella ornata]|uniref:Uncharacterized protein n=1 Tax=Westerdykella ornata TaxID=318751 RepID=A0A6A6J7C9_WESOR|nr:uncharacterized protein EI97DRAFT_386432 [Westerdykella ornata]KAF2272144.1 hypothetical protein EI97DRAFT_386432 [Westerdykella ornata]